MSTTKKIDDYFQGELEKNCKEKKEWVEEFRIQEVPETLVAQKVLH